MIISLNGHMGIISFELWKRIFYRQCDLERDLLEKVGKAYQLDIKRIV